MSDDQYYHQPPDVFWRDIGGNGRLPLVAHPEYPAGTVVEGDGAMLGLVHVTNLWNLRARELVKEGRAIYKDGRYHLVE